MNDQQLISHIEELGLSNKEARVYIAALRIGPSAVQKIADQSGIKRVTTYVILESLVGLGLVSQSFRGKKTYFVAEDPSNLKRLLEKREQELVEQNQNFDQVLPQLQGLKAIPQEMPEVKFYDGAEGVRTLFATFFAEYKGDSRDIYSISNLDEAGWYAPDVAQGKPNPYRIKNNIRSHMIYTSKRGPIYKDNDAESNRESYYMPPEKFPITCDINVMGDHVIMISMNGSTPIGVTIRNQDLANGMKNIFDMCWKLAENLNL